MQRECPQCHGALSYWARTRLVGVFRWRQAIPCSSCRVLLRCSRAIVEANLAFMAATVAGILGWVWNDSIVPVVIFACCSVIGVYAMSRVTIEVADGEGTQTNT